MMTRRRSRECGWNLEKGAVLFDWITDPRSNESQSRTGGDTEFRKLGSDLIGHTKYGISVLTLVYMLS
jgi:hypothetical protein